MRDEGLPGDVRALVNVSAALACRGRESVERTLREAASVAEPSQVEEAILQSYLFVGYPAALAALALWREISGRKPDPPAPEDWEGWKQRGASVCRAVYGNQYDDLRANIRALHADMEVWMVAEGYGKVLGRPGLSLAIRELCVVAQLAVLGYSPQLYSHLRGSLNAGASRAHVEEALALAGTYAGSEAGDAARATWARVLSRRGRRPSPGPGDS